MLGQESQVAKEFGIESNVQQEFFSDWANATSADDLPAHPSWHIGGTTLSTVILGCQIKVSIRGGKISALLGESLIAFSEAFYASAATTYKLISLRPELLIEVRQSDGASSPFSHRLVEDDCGETKIIVTHPVISVQEWSGTEFNDCVFTFFNRLCDELQLNITTEILRDMFVNRRIPDHALQVARSIIAVTSLLGASPSSQAEDWVSDTHLKEYSRFRKTPWIPNATKSRGPSSVDSPISLAGESTTDELFGVDALKHRDMAVFCKRLAIPS